MSELDNQKTHCIPVIHTQACNNREEPCSMMTQVNTDNQTHFEPCPFCGAGGGMIYRIEGKNVLPTGEIFKRPELFCDACKATVYFEDSSSKGIDDLEDMNNLKDALTTGWNARPTEVNTVTNDDVSELTRHKLVELRKQRSHHLIDESDYIEAVMDMFADVEAKAYNRGETDSKEYWQPLLEKAVLDGQIEEENLNLNFDVSVEESEDFRRGFDEAVDQMVRASERRITELQTKRKALDNE